MEVQRPSHVKAVAMSLAWWLRTPEEVHSFKAQPVPRGLEEHPSLKKTFRSHSLLDLSPAVPPHSPHEECMNPKVLLATRLI